MGLRIRTNVASLTAQRQLARTTQNMDDSLEKLSSGYRINKSADDAAGLAISESLRAKIRSLAQAKRNANDGISLVQVAEGSMNEISNILVRLRKLATQTATETIGNQERSFANREYTQLVDEIDRIANATEFNSLRMLKGSEENGGIEELTIHIGAGDGTVPNVDTLEIMVDELKVSAGEDGLGLGKGSEIGPVDISETFTRDIAAAKLPVIDLALKSVAGTRSTLGAKQSRLMAAVNNLSVQIENLSTTNSRVRDVDFASETARLTQEKIMSQSGVSVLQHANVAPELALALLR